MDESVPTEGRTCLKNYVKETFAKFTSVRLYIERCFANDDGTISDMHFATRSIATIDICDEKKKKQ